MYGHKQQIANPRRRKRRRWRKRRKVIWYLTDP